MIDTLIHVVFLGIEIEIFFLLLILISGDPLDQKKGKRHSSRLKSSKPKSSKPKSSKDAAHLQNTSVKPTAGAKQMEHLPLPDAALSEPDLAQKVADMPADLDISPDTSPQSDHCSHSYQDDIHNETTRIGIKERLYCGVKNIQGVNSYSSQVLVIEEEQGALIVEIYENGSIKASPYNDITNERRLNEVFRPLFDFDMPEQPGEKKFKITCIKKAELIPDGQAFCLWDKGWLKIEVA